MNTTCDFCEKWVVTSWDAHRTRMANMAGVPTASINPCPRCGQTYWASKPPSFGPEPVTDFPLAMKIIGALAVAVLIASIAALMMPRAVWGQTTFRDASGRQTGTASTSSNGTTTFRDSSGRQTGTASTNGNGTTTFRDGSGRMTGTAERRR
jgi:hypothetical protein